MRAAAAIGLSYMLLAACGEDSKGFVSTTSQDAAADAAGDGAALAADGGGCSADASAGLPACPVGPKLDPPTPAKLSLPARAKPRCTAIDAEAGFYTPGSIYAADGKLYVFSVDSTEATPKLLLHRGDVAKLTFEAPVTLLYGARKADLVQRDGSLHVLASRQLYAVELTSEDGSEFLQGQNVGPKEPPYNCEGYPPARYFRGDAPTLVATGNDYNDGLFGCHERIFVGARDGDAWADPLEVGEGDVVFAYQDGARALLFTSLTRVLESHDTGKTFQAIAGLDADGAVYTGKRVLLVRREVGTGGGISVARTEDAGVTWTRHDLLLEETAYGGLFIDADGANVGVIVATSDALVITVSADAGDTWSKPTRIARPSNLGLQSMAMSGGALAYLVMNDATAQLEACVVE